jgi:hypothetical protein
MLESIPGRLESDNRLSPRITRDAKPGTKNFVVSC